MNELIKEWTRAGKAIADYYEKAANPLLEVTPDAGGVELAAPKKRKAKAAAEAPLPAPVDPLLDTGIPTGAQPPAAPVAGEMSEADSLTMVRGLAIQFVKRHATQPIGVKAFQDLIIEKQKVGKIEDLAHAQRIQFSAALKAELAKPVPAAVA